MSHPVPDTTCDCCHRNKATRWFGQTSAVVCDSAVCHSKMTRDFNEALESLQDEDEY